MTAGTATQSEGKKNIVIVGGGFAGVTLAKRLERILPERWDIFLLSSTNLITYNPLLPEVVGASVLPGHVVAPLRHILSRTRIRMVEVTRIDTENSMVEYNYPLRDSIPFDHLIIAAGLESNMNVVPGMAAQGLPLKTLGDALHLRNQVIRNLEEATLCYDPARQKQLTTFVIAGGGFSGVEVAGEIHDLLAHAAPLFKRVNPDDCQVHVIHSRDHLLPEVTQSLGEYAERLMSRRGLRVHLNARVASVDAEGVFLASGTRIEAATVICTIGTQAHRFIAALPFADRRGRIPVAGSMAVDGYPGIWALGDCAVVPNATTGEASPTTAQFATRQALVLAGNLLAAIESKPQAAFAYQDRGQLAAIGHRKAIARIYGARLSGFPAWLLWRAFYLSRIPTLGRKVRLFLEWNWSMMFPKDVTLLGFERSPSQIEPGTESMPEENNRRGSTQ